MYWELLFNCFNDGENRTISVVLPFLLQERLAECAGIHPRRPEGHAGVRGTLWGPGEAGPWEMWAESGWDGKKQEHESGNAPVPSSSRRPRLLRAPAPPPLKQPK